jgi:hypothetical protein
LAVISGGLRNKPQFLDLAVNKPFKVNSQAKWEDWMMNGIHEYLETGQMKRTSYKVIVMRIVESWAAVGENCVRNGFIKPQKNAVVPLTMIMQMMMYLSKWKLKKYQTKF